MGVKTVDPIHAVLNGADPSGHTLVDHNFHFHKPPKAVRPDSDSYFKNCIAKKARPTKPVGQPGGSPKVFFKDEEGQKWMVKAYHEAVHPRTAPYMRYPTLGWSEMAMQALYHAGGIGHLIQRSHVAMHPTFNNREKPALAIKLDPEVNTSIKHMAGYDGPYPTQLYHDAARIGFMDFLTNYNDRHEDNLLFDASPHMPPHRLLACDNSAGFQYKVPNRFMHRTEKKDHLFYYIGDNRGFLPLINMEHYRQPWHAKHLDHALRWWGSNGEAIKQEFDNQLQAISNPHVAAFMKKNFDARANVLNNFVHAWHENPVADDYDPYTSVTDNHHILSVPMYPFVAKE